jgi:superfamily II DNA or RNA helicase
MAHELRDYQNEAIDNLRNTLRRGVKRIVLQMPTGAGKTALAGAIVRMATDRGKKVIFTVPALSLVDQTVESFESDGVLEIGVMQAFHERTDGLAPVQVCSVQTLMRRKIPKADLVIVDEAHVLFKFYKKWFNMPEWKDVPIIGLSATPWAKGMGDLYQELIIGTTTQKLIDEGYLSDFRCFAPSKPDLSRVRTLAGDYHEGDLGEVMDDKAIVADIVKTWLEKGENRPTLCFAVNRAHAIHIQDQFLRHGVPAGYMDAFTKLPDRQEIQRRFKDGELKVVCNVGVLTTGVDWDVRCIILARPTKSEMLYTQIIGRGLRTAENKDHCLILDHSATVMKLGFVTDIHHDTLKSGEKGASKSERERETPLPKECPVCTALKPAKARICPNCGHESLPMAEVRTVRGELVEIKQAKDGKIESFKKKYDDRAKFHAMLLWYANKHGYKPGWAAYKFKEIYKTWPPKGTPTPIEPSVEVLSIIRHLTIKSAKSKHGYKAKNNRRYDRPMEDYLNHFRDI